MKSFNISYIGNLIKTVCFLLLLIGLWGCAQNDWDKVTSYRDNHGIYHTLAIKLPDEDPLDKSYPALIFIHGHSWAEGSYNEPENHECCHAFAKNGYIALSIDYHFTPYKDPNGMPWPEQLDDAKLAVKWVRENPAILDKDGKLYQVNTKAIGVVGYSAGGQIALMMGLTNTGMSNKYYHYNSISDIQAVCSITGPTQLLSLKYESALEDIEGYLKALLNPDPTIIAIIGCDSTCTPESYSYCNIESNQCMLEAAPENSIHSAGLLAYASPYYQFDTRDIFNNVPFMMISGVDDTIVPYNSQHTSFFTKLKGTKKELTYQPVCTHSFFFQTQDGINNILTFFDGILKKIPPDPAPDDLL
jgi:pimeloyl-ACP methyl ester carboxylesterase